MDTFISRSLKIKLLLFFCVTLVTLVAFYFSDDMPDHFLLISSKNSYIGHMGYYLSSFVVFFGHYLGPWFFFPFVMYSILYTFVYSRRHYFIDLFNGFFIFFFCLCATYLFFPLFLGEGAHYILKNYLSFWNVLGVGFCFGVIFLWTTFQNFLEKFVLEAFAGSKLPEQKTSLPVASSNLEGSQADKKEIVGLESNPKPNPKPFENLGRADYKQMIAEIFKRRDLPKISSPKVEYFENIVRQIEDKLAEFGIEGKIVNILKGPVVDTFELDLGVGVKISKLTSMEKEISMALLGVTIRIVYPIVGKSTVGIEVPRIPRETIYLQEIVNSSDFKKFRGVLPIAMGKNVFGQTFVVDLANMPHMLVAGSTGAGKSVFINSLLVSLLAKCSPKRMKLILIDPKQLELVFYQRLPHLVMPVINDAKTANVALSWAVGEMERRYSILRDFGVRNIEHFNSKIKATRPEGVSKERQEGTVEKLPWLVVIIDEFADLILSRMGKEIEDNICRLAAKARAAGIHLVVATQRPSVDVITGLIKANFSTRISFRVTSSIDSRTILTQVGAEKLLGKGDMLYKCGMAYHRLHSAFVEEEDIEQLVTKLSGMGQKFHIDSQGLAKTSEREKDSPGKSNDDKEEDFEQLLDKAIKIIFQYQTASTSMIQRRLKIGYNKAANIIEELESRGIIGSGDGGRKREILVRPSSDQQQSH